MKKFEFENFVEENELDISKDFSPPIQKQVKIFNDLRTKSKDTVDEDREQVDRKLKERALKILADMEAEMEDRLENNDVVEVEKPKEKPQPDSQKKEPKPRFKKGDNVEITGGNPKYIGVIAEVLEHYPESGKDKEGVLIKSIELLEGKALFTIDLVKATTKVPTKISADEQIIELFFKKGIYRVGRSELIEKGFKSKLGTKEITVGKYQLFKLRYSYKYSIELIKK